MVPELAGPPPDARPHGSAPPRPAAAPAEAFPTRAVLAFTALGALYVWTFGLRNGPFLDSDEAIFGLMARHIIHKGQLPVYYWGQEYLGAVESYLAVPFFLLFGSTPQALRMVPMSLYVAVIPMAADVAYTAAGRRAAVWAAALLAAPPLAYTLWATKAHTFTEAAAASFAVLWLCVRLVRAPTERARLGWAAAAGLLLGVGLWWSYLIVVFALPGLALLVLEPRARSARVWALGLALTLVGASPALYRNAFQTHWATFVHAVHPDPSQARAGQPDHAVPEQALANLKEVAVPALLGFHDARPAAYRFGLPHGLWEGALLGLVLLGAAVSLRQAARPGQAPLQRVAAVAPLVGGLTMAGLYVFSRFGFEREPRYVMPLWLCFGPLWGWACWSLEGARRHLGVAVAAAVMAFQGYHTFLVEKPVEVAQWNPRAPANVGYAELIRRLKAMGKTRIWCDYWTSERISLESGEEIIAADPHGDRNAEAEQTLRNDPSACVLSTENSLADSLVRTRGWTRTYFGTDVEGLLVPQVLACPP